jgi:hypothetical protein
MPGRVNFFLPASPDQYLPAGTGQFFLAQGNFLPVILGQCLPARTVNFYLPKVSFYLLV